MLSSKSAVLSCRFFSTSKIILSQGTDLSRYAEGKYIKKFLSKRGAKAKKNWYKPFLAEPLEQQKPQLKVSKPVGVETLKKPPEFQVLEVQTTKNKQLSHVLYDTIVDVINSGELCEILLGKQVFITSVRMHKKHTGMSVYWDADRQDAGEVERLLFANSSKLRQLLISYHVLGRIPPVTFRRDRSHNLSELNTIFEKADYGPNYKPGVKSTITGTPYCNDGDDKFFGDSEKVLGLKTSSVSSKSFNYDEECDKSASVVLPEKTSFSGLNKDKAFRLLIENKEQEILDSENDIEKHEIKQTEDQSLDSLYEKNDICLSNEKLGVIDAKHRENDKIEQFVQAPHIEVYDCDVDIYMKTKEYFEGHKMIFHKNIYTLPHEDIMDKILRKKLPTLYGNKEKIMPTSSDVYNKIIIAQKKKKREDFHLKFGTKTKQRLLHVDVPVDHIK